MKESLGEGQGEGEERENLKRVTKIVVKKSPTSV
jgi:hypothetical protein